MMNKKLIYLDNAATTPLLPSVKEAMINALDIYANPSALYEFSQQSKHILEDCRKTIADYIGAKPETIIFTSGATEANNTAIIGAYNYVRSHGLNKNHIICGMTEHHSVLNTCKFLHEYYGVDVTYVGVDSDGVIDIDALERAIRQDTFLITVMAGNNEIGSLNNIALIGKIAKEHGTFFHTDITQCLGHITMSIKHNLKYVDFASASGHKLGSPKGVGFLYLRENIDIPSYLHGGEQESGHRAGTENLLGIIGFAEAVRQAKEHMIEWNQYVMKLTTHMRERILDEIPGARLNGKVFPRLPGNLNFSFYNIRSEELQILLDSYGVCVSTGSACNSASGEPSHVLLAIGLSEEEANSSIRFSLSHDNTWDEIDFAVDCLKKCISQLRERN